MPKYECNHPNCECDSKDVCLADRKNTNEKLIELKKATNGETK